MFSLQTQFRVWWLQALYIIVTSGFVTLLYLNFVKSAVPFGYILLAEGLGYGGAVIAMLLKRRYHMRQDIRIGLSIVALALLVLLLPFDPVVLLIAYTLLRVVGGILFFVPYNIVFFADTHSEKKLFKMSTYFAISAIVGVIAPIIGGWLLGHLGLGVFVGVAVAVLLIPLGLSRYVMDTSYDSRPSDIVKYIQGFRSIVMLDGALINGGKLLLALYLTTYVSDELQFGLLLSLIALLSAGLSLYMAKVSDAKKKRRVFIWPLSFASAAIFIGLFLVQSLWPTVVLILLYQVISTLYNPLRSNILLDVHSNAPMTWIARDVFLNIGRFGIFILLAIVLQLTSIQWAMLVVAAFFLLFPFLLRYKSVYQGAIE